MKAPSLPAPTRDLAKAILGIWKLETRQDVDASGQKRIDPGLGPDPSGVLCFAPGYFAAQFMKRDRSSTQGAAAAAPAAPALNNSSPVGGYDAYFGTYVIDREAGTLTTVLEGSISPGAIGSKFVRDVRVVGNKLTVQLATTAPDGASITRTLVFTRLM